MINVFTARKPAPWGFCWLVFMLCLDFQSAAQNCMQWVHRTDVGTPGRRYGHAMAYDPDRGVTVFFGGAFSEIGGEEVGFNDTWEYNGIEWKRITINGEVPPFRANHAMCYNSGYIFMGGGRVAGNSRAADWWAYFGAGNGTGTWIRLTVQFGTETSYFGMVMDEERGVPVQAGGVPANNDVSRATWRWNGNGWTLLTLLPWHYSGFAMAYDSRRHLTCLQGGDEATFSGASIINNRIFTLSSFSTNWTEEYPQIEGNLNAARAEHAMVYDSKRDRLVIFGGRATPGSLHLEGNMDSGWRSMPIATPQARAQPGMVYDSRRGVTVLFGGVGGTRYDDTWELVPILPSVSMLDPLNQVRCEFETFTIRAAVNPAPASIQWLKDGIPMLGEVQPNLTLIGVGPGDAGRYALRATDNCGNTLVGPEVMVVVNTWPRITAFNATRRDRCPGDSLSLSVTASSTLPLRYQWLKYGSPIPGATLRVLSFPSLVAEDTGDYMVNVENDCGWTYSAQVHVQVGPSIEQQPLSMVTNVCDPANFLVGADGVGTLRYQWRFNGAPLTNDAFYSDVNTHWLKINPVQYSHEGFYDVVITDDCGTASAVTSNPAQLSINPGLEWVLRTTNGPSPRSGHAMAYDSTRGVTLLFGGWQRNQAGDFVTLNDFWEWNGTRWRLLMPHSFSNGFRADGYTPTFSGRPVHRTQHMMAYDSARDRIVLFGGQSITPGGFQLFPNDLWEWDGAQWLFRTTNGPNGRVNASIAYDKDRRTTVMFGGFQSGTIGNGTYGAVWEWNGVQWNLSLPAGGPARNYSQDIGAMAYDSARRVTVFGPAVTGFNDSEFWTWDGLNWHQFVGYVAELWGVYDGDMEFDAHRQRSVWFGGGFGGAGVNHTAFFNGANWQIFTTSPRRPSPRLAHAMAYDEERWATVMFGGQASSYSPERYNGETWELIAVDKPLINEQPTDQFRALGQTATFGLTAVGRDEVTYQWFRNNVALVDDSRVSGATTPRLMIVNLRPSDAGRYSALVRNRCGDTLSESAELALEARLEIFMLDNVVTLRWFVPGSVLQHADTPAGTWTSLPDATSPYQPSPLGPAKFYRLRLNSGSQ